MQNVGASNLRYLTPHVDPFLKKKMVFLGGPRQVGKTTLCLSFLDPPSELNSAYMNWDDIHVQKKIRTGELSNDPIIVFDEIHKFKNWRNLVKGFYDKKKSIQKYLVTGSARLDYYRRGGDSLLGRYYYLRLHPFTVAELQTHSKNDFAALLKFGGFPEPLFTQSEREWKIWCRQRLYRVVHDDIRDLENLHDLSKIEMLAENLPVRVGSQLSINNLANDLQVNFRTAENWVSILERIYFCYRVLPYGPPKISAVKKEKKLYLWDWSIIEGEGPKFENLVASHLLKWCHYIEDTEGDEMELRFLRDLEKRELDFVVIKNKKPIFAVECKTGEKGVSRHIHYFKDRVPVPMFYQVHLGTKDYTPEPRIRVLPFVKFSQEIGLV